MAGAATRVARPPCLQFPNRYVDCADERWDENAQVIARARQDIPRLIAEIRRLNNALEPARPSNRETGEESNHNS